MGLVSPYSDTNMAHVFEDIFVFDTIRVYIPSKNLYTQGKMVLPYFNTIQGIYNQDFTFFETSRVSVIDVFLFSIPSGPIFHAKTCISRQNRPSIDMV